MKKFSRAVLAVIIGSLCFSVGEGLQLRPFPVSPPTEDIEASENTFISQYGPVDVPPQTQKRSKRHALDLAGPAPAGARKPVTPFSYLHEYNAIISSSLLFIPRPEGRGPPFLS